MGSMKIALETLLNWLNATPTVFDLLLWLNDLSPEEIAGAIGVLFGTMVRDAMSRLAAILILAWWRGGGVDGR